MFKLRNYFYPLEIIKLYRFLQKSRHFSRQQLLDFQNRKLRAVIQQAYYHVPYYREIFDNKGLKPSDIQTVHDLRHLPVLTKKTFLERYNDLVADNCEKFGPYIDKTSGTTGTPLEIMQDKNVRIANFAFFWRAWQVGGYRPYLRWAQVDGMVFPENDNIWRYHPSLNSLQISSFALSDRNCERVLNKLNTFKPRILRGYPSALYILARYARKNEAEMSFRLKSILTNAETLQSFQRDLIEDAFKCRVFDVYSAWDGVCIISECEQQVKHHHMEYSILELLDENNHPVGLEETGEITGTSLFKMAMPLIRYKTKDLAARSTESCPCGRGHDTIEAIDGRIEDIIITPEGWRVGRMDAAFKHCQGFDFAQIIQEEVESIRVKLVKSADFTSSTLTILEKHIRHRVGDKINVNFEFVDEIKSGPNGKIRFVKNKIPNINKKIG